MRGKDTQQSSMFSYVSPERRVPADHPLRPIRAMVDMALKGLSRSFGQMYRIHHINTGDGVSITSTPVTAMLGEEMKRSA
jgi:hypothetical protein